MAGRSARNYVDDDDREDRPIPSTSQSKYPFTDNSLTVPVAHIGSFIGPKGAHVQSINARCDVRVSVSKDDGKVTIYAPSQGALASALRAVKDSIALSADAAARRALAASAVQSPAPTPATAAAAPASTAATAAAPAAAAAPAPAPKRASAPSSSVAAAKSAAPPAYAAVAARAAGGAASSNTAAAAAAPAPAFTRSTAIPAGVVARFIGKQGQSLNALQTHFSSSIRVSPKTDGQAPQTVTVLSKTQQNLDLAMAAVQKSIDALVNEQQQQAQRQAAAPSSQAK
jgi:polyribonucleotide nucleotidyltransferase